MLATAIIILAFILVSFLMLGILLMLGLCRVASDADDGADGVFKSLEGRDP